MPTLRGAGRPMPRRAFVSQIMGLPVSVHVRGPGSDGPQVAMLVERAFERLRADDAVFSTYRPDSDVSQIRRGQLRLGEAHPRVRRVVALCKEATARTEGAFSAWLPGPDGRPAFDPSGLVKGWAVQDTFDQLGSELGSLTQQIGHGPYDALISAGGDIAVMCGRVDTPDWQIGVEDPQDRSRLLTSIPLRRGAVATSGTAARGRHIVDPGTGAPVDALLAATVIGPDLTWADVYATAAFVKGAGAVDWIGSLADHTGLTVSRDGTLRVAPILRTATPGQVV